jgi:hypothetical protein
MKKFLEVFPVPGAQIRRASGYRADQVLNAIEGMIFVPAGFTLKIGFDGLTHNTGAGLPLLAHQRIQLPGEALRDSER